MTSTHGFVDESIREGCYRLTVVEINSQDRAKVAQEIWRRVLTGQTRLHIASERPERKRQILRFFSTLPISATTFEVAYDGCSDDQIPRDRCLRALVQHTYKSSLTLLAIDTRGPDRDRRDRRTIAETWQHRDNELRYDHIGSRDQPLLALPDGIGWAVGKGGQWHQLIANVTHINRLDEKG